MSTEVGVSKRPKYFQGNRPSPNESMQTLKLIKLVSINSY